MDIVEAAVDEDAHVEEACRDPAGREVAATERGEREVGAADAGVPDVQVLEVAADDRHVPHEVAPFERGPERLEYDGLLLAARVVEACVVWGADVAHAVLVGADLRIEHGQRIARHAGESVNIMAICARLCA